MFSRILIANRGEIACRVIRTARRMGIETVAVYSDADRDALHVQLADHAVRLGPPPASESYLAADHILQACHDTGAQAVHPGYGFLSENAAFAQRVIDAGIAFIGPRPHAITQMGDKITSKRLAAEAGVNTVPGFDGAVEHADHAVEIAREIGYPVMLKASAGGGGKGMRIARDDAACREGFTRAASEARNSFGDERIFVEKFIERPRHIEIQVLADAHGNAIYLGERECSLQRRHQKVIEEAPSPFLDAATRKAMGEQAVALARAVEYQSAGTVEFIVDADRNFYFLEMNTRLQVEHPVTEYVTGLDLVELMIRVAAGDPLPVTQGQVKLGGWSIEARVYAEDPLRGFLPSIGRLVRYVPPTTGPHVRVDSGAYEGGEVSMHYDPMIAKVITHGGSRLEAITHMRRALNEFYVRGVANNLGFLSALVGHPLFESGDISTDTIGQLYPEGFRADDVVHDEPGLLIAVAATIHRRYMDRAARISDQIPGYERRVGDEWVVVMDHQQHPVTVKLGASPTVCEVQVGHGAEERRYEVNSLWQFGQPLFRGVINGRDLCVQVERRNMIYRLQHWGATLDVRVLSARAAELLATMPIKEAPDTSGTVLAPMPGLLLEFRVQPGDEVAVGSDLAVIEAMKMQNVVHAVRRGVVAKLIAKRGDTLAVDQPLLEYEAT
ncbi:MAG: acetyl/propionyl-CoA carboxylase subunit alpha [Planctomycetaceae bacterium]|nr:acetyl/propionyl-CoA carboxylase subunit alpha [Planctomycetaceae bacterium]